MSCRMESAVCQSCKSPKGHFQCGACRCTLCKKCAQVLEKNSFPLLDPLPEVLKHKHYCVPCYNQTVGPALDDYQLKMRQAKQVFIFNAKKGEETRHYSRTEKKIQVEGCLDEREALIRLAFKTVSAGFNAAVDVTVAPKKIRNEGYQTMRWHAVGIPTLVDAAKLNRENKEEREGTFKRLI